MHTGKELEARCVEKGRLSCVSDATPVVSVRSDSTSAVKVNRCKTKPHCNRLYIFFN